MKKNKDRILEFIRENSTDVEDRLFTTQEISEVFQISRANVSTSLNQLVQSNDLYKTTGKPVKYGMRKGIVHNPDDAFSKMIGMNGSLRNAIRLSKAFILYPEKTMALISGEPGSGQYLMARSMYSYAIDQHIIKPDARFVVLNLELYPNEESIIEAFTNGSFGNLDGDVLYIEHVEKINERMRRGFQQLEEFHETSSDVIIICSKEIQPGMDRDQVIVDFPFRINLPALNKRPFGERLELIEYFFRKESEKVKREIVINSELLRCFLLYHCPGNVTQLKNDIRVGCANAFVREAGSTSKQLHVYMNDCPPFVRKGFLAYKENREQIEHLIPENFTYAFNPREGRKEADNRRVRKLSIYDSIDEKVRELKKRSISDDDIMTIVSADIEADMHSHEKAVEEDSFDRTAIEKVVDMQIVDAVDDFLKEASLRFNKIYAASVFHALCFQLSSSSQQTNKDTHLTSEKVGEIVRDYPEEYKFTTSFLIDLSEKLKCRFTTDDCAIATLYLSGRKTDQSVYNEPSLLIVMHGKVASAIRDTVSGLYPNRNIYSYDLLLDEDMNQSYENIKDLCMNIAGNEGILVFYDMGSLKKIMEMIAFETSIRMRMIEMPVTLLALDAVLKFGMQEKLDDVYEELVNTGFGSFASLKEQYRRLDDSRNKIIVTLCMSGSGSAVQMKQYLEKNLDLEDIEVIAMAVNDRTALMESLNLYRKNRELLCIVGTYNPHIHGIPYISVAQLFDTPADKLEMLLALENSSEIPDFDYKELYDYLEEQLEYVSIHKVRKQIHKAIRMMKKKIRNVDAGEEVGLFMHIACALDRIASGGKLPVNVRKDNLISRHKKMYNDLQDILKPLEQETGIHFEDDEIATIMDILR